MSIFFHLFPLWYKTEYGIHMKLQKHFNTFGTVSSSKSNSGTRIEKLLQKLILRYTIRTLNGSATMQYTVYKEAMKFLAPTFSIHQVYVCVSFGKFWFFIFRFVCLFSCYFFSIRLYLDHKRFSVALYPWKSRIWTFFINLMLLFLLEFFQTFKQKLNKEMIIISFQQFDVYIFCRKQS